MRKEGGIGKEKERKEYTQSSNLNLVIEGGGLEIMEPMPIRRAEGLR